MTRYLLPFLLLFFASCQELVDAPVPALTWAPFDAANARPLSASQRAAMEGIYTITTGADDFGDEAALKWTYVAAGPDTTFILSFFCREDVRYFICQGKKTGDTVLLNGYWRNIENTKTGRVHLTVTATAPGSPSASVQPLSISGLIGSGNSEPDRKVVFQYQRPLYNKTPYYIIAHRGGGRNNDLLPASENSVQMIPLAAQLGANGIEIDVQLTKDGVPVLFHDANLNDRLTTKTGIHGGIDTYTWPELKAEVLLKRGGKIPSLEEALETVLTQTPLEMVWLDCKFKAAIPAVRALQEKYVAKAKAAGRKLEIIIGLPDEEVLTAFMALPGYKNIPSLCELDTAKAAQAGADFWAPSWTKGTQDSTVAAQNRAGRKTLVWTVDVPDKIKEFMYEGKFNGMVTNRPTMAAYYYYARK